MKKTSIMEKSLSNQVSQNRLNQFLLNKHQNNLPLSNSRQNLNLSFLLTTNSMTTTLSIVVFDPVSL